jgi:Type VI secretion system/phage-baseplate injector OB domain
MQIQTQIARMPLRGIDEQQPATEAEKASAFSVPEVDDEVLVAFAHGDLRGPILLGSLWSASAEPPDQAR